MSGTTSTETLKISDGTTMEISRVPNVDDETWEETKKFIEGNPQAAKSLQSLSRNPDAMRGFLQTQAIAEHYAKKLSDSDEATQDRLKLMSEDPELAPVFEDLKKNGLEALKKYYDDEDLMRKISQKMGGLPQELQPVMQKLHEASMTIHDAAIKGDMAAVKEFLDKKKPLDTHDHKGITPLGYAIGANRLAVVKLLLDNRANPFAVDASGNSGLHYAAGYGRKELCEYLLKVGVSVNQANAQGQTPLTVATGNKQAETVAILKKHGA